jgi:xanthine dehydrogenase YagR molybdenum-binding subunit
MSAAIRPNLRRPATAKVRMDEERKVTVEMDMTDIGTGSYTIFAQVAAETLDLPVEKVRVKLGRSSYAKTPGSGGSFGAASCCSAVRWLIRWTLASCSSRRRPGTSWKLSPESIRM